MAWMRYDLPEPGNPYYNNSAGGGFSKCITAPLRRPEDRLNVLPNCVGAAWGAFNETYVMNTGKPAGFYYHERGNGGDIYDACKNAGYDVLPPSAKPPEGGMISWSNSNAGHVAYICKVHNNDKITVINSDYNGAWYWELKDYYRGNGNWGYNGVCNGFVINPGVNETPSLIPPTIESVSQLNKSSIIIKGDMKGISGITERVDVYIKYNSNSVSSSDYDIKTSATGSFNITVDKPYSASSVAVILIQINNDGSTSKSNIYTRALIASFPYINVKYNGTMEQGLPYIYVKGNWKAGVPYIYTNGKWIEIYNDKV